MLLRTCAALLLALSCIFSPSVAFAQAGTAIHGRILETSAGLPVAGAQVELRHDETVVAKTTTASDGSFTFASVAPGGMRS